MRHHAHPLSQKPYLIHLSKLTLLLTALLLSGCIGPFGRTSFPSLIEAEAGPDCTTEGCYEDEICVARGDDDGTTEEWVCLRDRDHDEVPYGEDCNDRDAMIYPGAEELCDDIDHDCDGQHFTSECDAIYGPQFKITILLAESNYSWDDGVPFLSNASPPDMYVEFGKMINSFNQSNCYTPEVSDSNIAMWESSCFFTFEQGDSFKIEIRDLDNPGAELIEKWKWEGSAMLYQFLTDPGEKELIEGENRLIYRLEVLD